MNKKEKNIEKLIKYFEELINDLLVVKSKFSQDIIIGEIIKVDAIIKQTIKNGKISVLEMKKASQILEKLVKRTKQIATERKSIIIN